MDQLEAQGGEDKDGTVRDRIDAVLQMVQNLAMEDENGAEDVTQYDEFGEQIMNAPKSNKVKTAIVEEATELVQQLEQLKKNSDQTKQIQE